MNEETLDKLIRQSCNEIAEEEYRELAHIGEGQEYVPSKRLQRKMRRLLRHHKINNAGYPGAQPEEKTDAAIDAKIAEKTDEQTSKGRNKILHPIYWSKRTAVALLAVVVMAFGAMVVGARESISLAAEVQENFTKLSELSMEQAMSSNPYDYINNEYFDNIVELGVPAVKVIEQGYYNGKYAGLNAYIAALAIQKITDVNLYECTGEDWETGEQFFHNWNITMNRLPETFDEIINSDDSMEVKISSIEKYGVFGEYFLSTAVNEKTSAVEFNGETISIHDQTAIKGAKITKLSEDEMDAIKDYLESIPK